MTTGKTIVLNICTFVSKVISLLFNMLSRFLISFLPGSQLSFNFMAVVTICSDLEPKKIKSVTVSIFPIYLSRSDGTGCHDFSFLNTEF